jgi:hypothetical protein
VEAQRIGHEAKQLFPAGEPDHGGTHAASFAAGGPSRVA